MKIPMYCSCDQRGVNTNVAMLEYAGSRQLDEESLSRSDEKISFCFLIFCSYLKSRRHIRHHSSFHKQQDWYFHFCAPSYFHRSIDRQHKEPARLKKIIRVLQFNDIRTPNSFLLCYGTSGITLLVACFSLLR
jgi:hypothetical protein